MAGILNALDGVFGNAPTGKTSAVPSFSDPVDLVNLPSGEPTQERWPGATDPANHGPDVGPGVTRGLPQDASYGADPFSSGLPHEAQGGGYQDTAWMSGHDGPVLPWDSSAGAPFTGSGAVNPALHGEDTGGVFQKSHVVAAAIGRLIRHTGVGQTYNRVAATQDTIGQTSPNDRRDLDQQQWHDPTHGAWRFDVPYAERPIYNNVAYESMPIEPTGSTYTPAGDLPDRSAYWDPNSYAYESPADPVVHAIPAAPAAEASNSGGWLLG